MVKVVFKSGAIVDIDIELVSIGRDPQGQVVSLEWKAKSQRIFKLEMGDVSCIIDDMGEGSGGNPAVAESMSHAEG